MLPCFLIFRATQFLFKCNLFFKVEGYTFNTCIILNFVLQRIMVWYSVRKFAKSGRIRQYPRVRSWLQLFKAVSPSDNANNRVWLWLWLLAALMCTHYIRTSSCNWTNHACTCWTRFSTCRRLICLRASLISSLLPNSFP